VIQANGARVRRKVSGKDAMYVASNANNMHLLLTHDATSATNANLKQLAADLIASLNAANQIGRTIDATHQTETSKKLGRGGGNNGRIEIGVMCNLSGRRF